MPTTSNFGWTTPADTDLVKDGAAAIRTLGNGIDTSLVDLKGGTTGQILSKNSNTDLDYIWINNDQGDITAVTAGTGLTGGGTTGAVTLTNDMATTITAAGDIVVGTGSGTYDNLPIGTTGQVLTADTTVSPYKVKWAAAAAGGKVLQVVQDVTTTQESTTSTSWQDTDLSQAITPSSATSKVLCIVQINGRVSRSASTSTEGLFQLLRTSTSIARARLRIEGASGTLNNTGSVVIVYLDSPNTTSATTYKVQMASNTSGGNDTTIFKSIESEVSTLTLVEIGA